MFLLCCLLCINIHGNEFDIAWVFVMIYLLQILFLPKIIILDIKHDMQIMIHTFSMFALMTFVQSFNLKYIIRLISWMHTTPLLLNNILESNKHRKILIVLHEISYFTELIIIIFKIPSYFESIVYCIFCAILFIHARHVYIHKQYNIYVNLVNNDKVYIIGKLLYNEFIVLLWVCYGIVRLAYLTRFISPFTEWLLFNILDTITKSIYLFLKKFNLDIVKQNAIVSKQIQSAYTKESLLYLQPYLDAAINYDALISIPKQVNKLENVIVIFFDLIGYTEISKTLASNDIANVLSELYSNIDILLINYNKVKKVETVGDEYMAVISLENEMNITECVLQSILFVKQSIEIITEFKHLSLDSEDCEVCTSFQGARAGMHTGNVTKAMIGLFVTRTQYFGSVINIGSRMENTGKPNMVRITNDMMELLRKCKIDVPATEEWIEVKGIGIMQTFIIDIMHVNLQRKTHSISSYSSKRSSYDFHEYTKFVTNPISSRTSEYSDCERPNGNAQTEATKHRFLEKELPTDYI